MIVAFYKTKGDEIMQVQYLKPFYTKVTGDKLRIVFAHQYLSILRDSLIYHFIPTEDKEIVINLNTQQLENHSDTFVFQSGNKFTRLSLRQFFEISNTYEFINPIIHNEMKRQGYNLDMIIIEVNTEKFDLETQVSRKCEYGIPDKFKPETNKLITELMQYNKENLINKYLDDKNFDGLNDVLGIQLK